MMPHIEGLIRRIPSRVSLLTCLTTLLIGFEGPAQTIEQNSALARIEAAAAAHPDDPDLAWARVRSLARMGRGESTVEWTRQFIERWPAHRPDAYLEIARTLLDQGAPQAAQSLLDEALSRSPRSGMAHFYRAMAMRANGEPEAAQREFQAAAILEPSLQSETLLVRALLLFDMKRSGEAVSLLQELLRIDPTSDTAMRARLLLRQRDLARAKKRLRAEALAGLEWDQNVTLEGTESERRPSEREDFRGVWGAGISGQPWLADRGGLLVGYRYDQTYHDQLRDFDTLQNAIFASLSLQPIEALKQRLALRLDTYAYDTLQHLDHALAGASIRPNVLWAIGPRAGVLRAFGAFELAEFDGDPLVSVWERDSLSGGLGVEQIVPLPLLCLAKSGSSVAVSFSWLRTVTQADPGGFSDGFDGDFDGDSYRLRGLGNLVLPWSLTAQVEVSYSHDQYLNDNFAHWLETGDFEQRRDEVLGGRIGLSRPIVRFTRLELYWRGSRRASNVAIFDYDKQIVGMLIHVSTD